MEWFSENWIWVVVAIAMVAMHLFGHGGHGGQRRDGEDKGAGHRH